jgi:tRNA nucleotidyltransferase (CCA-adding enzyme)
MSSPVRTISTEHPLARLRDELPTWGHTGVPVLRTDDRGAPALVGIVSRHDVERAAREGRLHLAAGSCMSHPVHTTCEDASLEEALDAMTSHAVGRLPVLREGALVGIVTRSDVRAALYGAA